ncbi:siderophore ABC transporter substrate-binding protein [Clostridium polynesiense]|uniref:siderophore ABC transporter substrate-binding protein n=1 Tax=Clostridium polynesiense TaxID=1325933 RepID=UPI000590D5A9|nr:siderophore ABC transporter substrate-binding protein [Clostridium polynesiense]
MKEIILSIVSAVVAGTLAVGCVSTGKGDASDKSAKGEVTEYKTVSVKHKFGEVNISKKPETVAVFDLGALDTLDALGVEVSGIPQNNLPDYLNKYSDKKYVNIGGLKEPDLEAISELNPDLIIISGRQADFYKDLSSIAPTIYIAIDNKNYIKSFKDNTAILGDIFDVEDKAAEKINVLDKRTAEIKSQTEDKVKEKKSLTILANDGNISAYGPGSRFALIDELGFKAVDDTLEDSTHGQKINYEYINEKNPDYIFVIDRSAAVGTKGASSASKSLENDLVKKTSAYKNGKMIYLEPSYWYLSGGGLTSFGKMIEEVAAALK